MGLLIALHGGVVSFYGFRGKIPFELWVWTLSSCMWQGTEMVDLSFGDFSVRYAHVWTIGKGSWKMWSEDYHDSNCLKEEKAAQSGCFHFHCWKLQDANSSTRSGAEAWFPLALHSPDYVMLKPQAYWHYAAWGCIAASTVCVKVCHQFIP